MRKVGLFLFFMAFGSVLWTPLSLAQSVKVYVDRNPVVVDETFRLFVEAEGLSSSDTPTFQNLEENFTILGTSHSQQMSIINGQTSSVTTWVTTLAPKRAGMLSIPSMQVGSESTPPLSLTVKELNQVTGAASQRDIFLEAEIDSSDPYVQGQIMLTLRLLTAVPLEDGKLDDPEIEWGMVERVGKDTSYETIRNGRRYQVTERRYVITPQTAGAQIIPPVSLSGMVPDDRSRRSTLDQFFGTRRRNQGGGPFLQLFPTNRQIHIRSPQLSVAVKQMPASLKGNLWLPAREFTITERWSSDTTNIQMSESLTRTVVMNAKGLRGEQLPELPIPDYGSIKTYPDKPRMVTEFDGTWIVGTREEKYAFVPTQPGSVTIPGIRIPWWNIETNQWEVAELPSMVLQVQGDVPTQLTEVPRLSANQVSDHGQASQDSLNQVRDTSDSDPRIFGSRQESWIMGGLIGVWVLTLLGWWWDRRKRNNVKKNAAGLERKKVVESERKAIQAIKTASLEPSAVNTRRALLSWASLKGQGKPCLTLAAVARILVAPVPDNTDVEKAIWNLDRTLYTTTEHHLWDGQRFWETIQPAFTAKSRTKQKVNETLPNLYLH